MADLTAKKREKLPAKDFGLPEKARTKDAKKESGNYPMPDKAHAAKRQVPGCAAARGGQSHEEGTRAHRPQGRQDPRRLRPSRPPSSRVVSRRRHVALGWRVRSPAPTCRR